MLIQQAAFSMDGDGRIASPLRRRGPHERMPPLLTTIPRIAAGTHRWCALVATIPRRRPHGGWIRASSSSSSATYPALQQIANKEEARVSIADFRRRYDSALKPGERMTDAKNVVLMGRVVSRVRESSAALRFFHLESACGRVQIMAERSFYDARRSPEAKEYDAVMKDVKLGDVVMVRGVPAKTKRDELSVLPTEVRVLAPCLVDLPVGRGDGVGALSDPGVLYRNREMDLLIHGAPARAVFEARAKVISSIRSFLDERDFVEVETPILATSAGGASARPFVTTNRALHLRIAPELALKRLIVGGFEAVYELGKVFRDEGLSSRHNPEFTSCELYKAYATMEDLIPFTEELLSTVARRVGEHLERKRVKERDGGISPLTPHFTPLVDLTRTPYARVSISEELASRYRLDFRRREESVDDKTEVEWERDMRDRVARVLHEKFSYTPTHEEAGSLPRLVDKLVGFALEPELREPTFLVDHPLCLSPLARESPTARGISERFELFARGMELCNAYSELNDPHEQRRRFAKQAELKASGDDEAQVLDEPFCKALELGLPPTAGFGVGIDRLVMVLLGRHSIRDAVLFPLNSNS